MRTNKEKGTAAMMAVFLMGTLFTLFLTAFVLIQTNNALIGKQLAFYGQATNAAQAGLVEGLAWFRKQDTQPVTAFAPQRNLTALPPVNETDDASIGLVREYDISPQGKVRGRYEVRKTEVRDVTLARGKLGSGTVWEVSSEGIVFVQENSSVAYNVAPNRILNRQTARTEFQRLAMVLPGNAGIIASQGSSVTLASRARVFGGAEFGALYQPSTGSPSVCASPCRLTGTKGATGTVSPFNSSISAVFGVEQQELINMADISVTNVADLPADLPDMALIVVNGNAVFTQARPLIGSGILVVFGNLTIDTNSFSSFNGLIYVTGNYIQRAPSQVSGTVMALGTFRMEGTGDYSEISYDKTMLQQVQLQMGQYRFSRSINYQREMR